MLEDIRDLLRQISAPARNNYFYGKLLRVDHFKMEQLYFNRKRWLLNRLGLGTGVLCGLETAVTEDDCLMIYPGVAIDPLGREIVVPAPYCIENLRQPTDSRGRPDGEPLDGDGSLTVCLYYYECEAEPVPVMVGECDTGPACAPNVIRERYRIQVHLDLPESQPGSVPDEACQEIYPEDPPDDFDRRRTVQETLETSCEVSTAECVVLATVTCVGDEMTVDPYTYRPVVYSNAMLFDLLMCLAEKVDACCRTLLLRYVSGDAQQEQPANILPAPFVVEVVDGQGNAVEGEEVAFKVRGGGGFVDNDIMASGTDGRAQTLLTLGKTAGLNVVEASLKNGATVVFYALGTSAEAPPEPTLPPVINAIWPPNASQLIPRADERFLKFWLENPHLEITFDREMTLTQIQDAEALSRWLRVYQLTDLGEISVVRVRVAFKEVVAEPILEVDGFTVSLALDVAADIGARYLVLIRSQRGVITDRNGLQLDAEFAGTALSNSQLNTVWKITQSEIFGSRELWDGLVDTGAVLPQSGDGQEGGLFHSWFAVQVRLA